MFSVRLLPVVLLFFVGHLSAAPSLDTIMQDPDWIGPPVEAAWWQFDGSGYVYTAKRSGSSVRDWYRHSEDTGPELLAPEALARIDGPNPVLATDGRQAVSIVEGSLVWRDLESGEHRRLYTGAEAVIEARFNPAGDAVLFEADGRWWRVSLDGSAAMPITDLRFEDAPHAAADTAMVEDQLRLFATLERERRHEEDEYQRQVGRGQGTPGLGAAPWYLDKHWAPMATWLSADGRWLLVSVQNARQSAEESTDAPVIKPTGKQDRMPHYVTRSGYVEVENVRRLVGRKTPHPEALWLLDLEQRRRTVLDLDGLSGRDTDPLAELKTAQGLAIHSADNLRPLSVSGVQWHPATAQALIQVRSLDHKDRWTLRLDAASGEVREIHRLTDPAWVNWKLNEFGWVPGTDTAWLLSEESGYSHLYTVSAAGRTRQRTEGEFEVRDVQFTLDGSAAFMRSNREHPTEWDIYRLTLDDTRLVPVTYLRGVESFALHPDGERVLVRHSGIYTPTQAAILHLGDGSLTAATDTLTEAYRAIDWQIPEFVGVPSSHGAPGPIWSKFYPAAPEFTGPRPAVLFVHGAGYTQNTDHHFPYYFREQMFHNLLTSRGYHVLDMDFRASEGYGRDWRTAIYRQMGTPELEDLIDGVNWLVAEHGADPSRIGVYGGSYGGFMTFMAMFKAPDIFAAGASLRPVTDWRHYNHWYTSHILNTPQVDPEAHRRSSPIEFVEGLKGNLLIAHGMLDDNVFYKDSVRLVQRLIELGKEDWELASYPMEPHGFVHPESWLDEYRRILKLFEETLNSE